MTLVEQITQELSETFEWTSRETEFTPIGGLKKGDWILWQGAPAIIQRVNKKTYSLYVPMNDKIQKEERYSSIQTEQAVHLPGIVVDAKYKTVENAYIKIKPEIALQKLQEIIDNGYSQNPDAPKRIMQNLKTYAGIT